MKVSPVTTGVDPAAPGTRPALTVRLMEGLDAEGFVRFDLLPPADSYKIGFTACTVAVGSVYIRSTGAESRHDSRWNAFAD